MGEACINGQANNQTCIKDSFWKGKEMVEEHFGGQMVVGMKDNLETEYKVGMESYIEKEDIHNMKDHGTMECLMGKVFNFSKMVKNMKDPSNRINSTVMVYFISKIQQFMEYGKIMS